MFRNINSYTDFRTNRDIYYWNEIERKYLLLKKRDWEYYSADPEDFNKIVIRYKDYRVVFHLFDLFVRDFYECKVF